MSKKQREKVEEEVNFHQSQNRIRASSGTSPDPWHSTPDSTGPSNEGYPQFQQYDLPQGNYPTPNQYPFTGQQQPPNGQQQYDEFVDSTTPNTTFDTRNTTNIETDTQHLPQGMLYGHRRKIIITVLPLSFYFKFQLRLKVEKTYGN